jgi:hypothetical protein
MLVFNFKTSSEHLPGNSEENYGISVRIAGPPVRKSNRRPPEHKASVISDATFGPFHVTRMESERKETKKDDNHLTS